MLRKNSYINTQLTYGLILMSRNILLIIILLAVGWYLNLWWIAIPVIFFAALTLYRLLYILSFKYKVTDEQIVIQKGVLGRAINFIELYRIKDISISQSFVERLFNLSNITIFSFDSSEPFFVIRGIKAPGLADFVRLKVQESRKRNNIYTIER